MATSKRSLGLMLISALLLIMALRAGSWLVIGGLLGQVLPGPARWLLGLLVMVVLLISAIGLLGLREWARWLTLVLCSVYSGLTLVNIVVLWPRLRSSRLNLSLGMLNAAEAMLVLVPAWWYLNRKDVRRLFRKT